MCLIMTNYAESRDVGVWNDLKWYRTFCQHKITFSFITKHPFNQKHWTLSDKLSINKHFIEVLASLLKTSSNTWNKKISICKCLCYISSCLISTSFIWSLMTLRLRCPWSYKCVCVAQPAAWALMWQTSGLRSACMKRCKHKEQSREQKSLTSKQTCLTREN